MSKDNGFNQAVLKELECTCLKEGDSAKRRVLKRIRREQILNHCGINTRAYGNRRLMGMPSMRDTLQGDYQERRDYEQLDKMMNTYGVLQTLAVATPRIKG